MTDESQLSPYAHSEEMGCMASVFWPSCLPAPEVLAQGAEERRAAGQAHFTEVLLALLQSVSHPQLSELADWACNGSGALHTSQISQLRNQKVRMLGSKAIDALGRVNQAAWTQRHHPHLLPQLGCAPLTPRIEKILAAFQPLVDPSSGEPLGSGALLEIHLGLRRLPVELPRVLVVEEAQRLAERLTDWLEGELRHRGWSLREAGQRLQQAWGAEASGAKRLVRVLAGLETYSAKQLIDGWEPIAMAVLRMLDHQPDVWALADALLAGEQPVRGKAAVMEQKAKGSTGSKRRTPSRSQPGPEGKAAGASQAATPSPRPVRSSKSSGASPKRQVGVGRGNTAPRASKRQKRQAA
jgi:hypothetical protein